MPILIKGSGGKKPKLHGMTVTPDGTVQRVNPDSGYDGLSYVVVGGDDNLVPENIKNGIAIYGVIGTFSAAGYECETVSGIAEETVSSEDAAKGSCITLADSAVSVLAKHPGEYPDFMFVMQDYDSVSSGNGIMFMPYANGSVGLVYAKNSSGSPTYSNSPTWISLTRSSNALTIETSRRLGTTADAYKFIGNYTIMLFYANK